MELEEAILGIKKRFEKWVEYQNGKADAHELKRRADEINTLIEGFNVLRQAVQNSRKREMYDAIVINDLQRKISFIGDEIDLDTRDYRALYFDLKSKYDCVIGKRNVFAQMLEKKRQNILKHSDTFSAFNEQMRIESIQQCKQDFPNLF